MQDTQIDLIKNNKQWFTLIGVALIIIGIIGIVAPVVSSFAFEVIFGCALMLGGIIIVIGSFFSGAWKKFILMFISGVLNLIVGFLLLKNPLQGVLALTLLLAIFLLADGIFKIITSFQLKGHNNWIWMLISGIISLVLSILIFAEYPQSGTFIIGLYLGFYLFFSGFSIFMLANSPSDQKAE